MALRDATPDLVKHRFGGSAARCSANRRDDAEVAGEAAAVLDLHEGTDPVEARVRLHAAERSDVAGHEGRRLLAASRDDRDVVRQA